MTPFVQVYRFVHTLFVVLCLLFYSHQALALWDTAALENAATQAQEDAELLYNRTGPLLKQLSQSAQQTIFDKIEPNIRADRSGVFANPAEVYATIADYLAYQDAVGYYYAAARVSTGNSKLRYLFQTYENIIYSDYDSQAFAFAQLAKIAPNFYKELKPFYEQLKSNHGFSLNSVDIDHEQDQAEICLYFSKSIQAAPQQQWQRLITLTPASPHEGIYKGNEICYFGEWQTDYHIKIDANLISTNQLAIEETLERTVNTGNRDPMLRFATTGQTLIADKDAALTVESSNVNTVEVTLWTLATSNLSHEDIVDMLNSNYYSYDTDRYISRVARQLYQGQFDPQQLASNTTSQSRLLLSDMGATEAGIYVAQIRDSDKGQSKTIAFSLSNSGFSAYLSDDGLWAELRDLRTFKALNNAEVILYARDNSEIARARTDQHGMAQFDQAAINGKGGATPDHLLYQDQGDIAYLHIDNPGFDLSDKGLSDRRSQSDIQSWLWLDRGVYRPKDNIHAMWLLRRDNHAYNERNLWLSLARPDGVIVHEQLISPDDSGAYHFHYHVPLTARLGAWQLKLSLAKDSDIIDSATVRIEAIRAQQIAAQLEASAQSKQTTLNLQADWLYGAPASGLSSDGSWHYQPREITTLANWQIGRHDENIDPSKYHINEAATNTEGKRELDIDNQLMPHSTLPLTLSARLDVHTPDGQAVSANAQAPLKRPQPYVALQVQNKQAKIIAFGDDNTLLAQALDWQLYRVRRDGYWYRQYDKWQYQYIDNKTAVAQGTLNTNSDNPSVLNLDINDGLWLLEVSAKDSRTAASTMIEFGRWASASSDSSPETLTLSSDKPRYQDGDTVRLNIRAPFDGPGSVKLAHGDIFRHYPLTFRNHEASIDFKWSDEWQNGVWLLASAWNDGDSALENKRAVGLTWLGTDLSPFTLNPEISAPEAILPEHSLDLSVDVPNAPDGTWVNIAIIDEGLYRLAPPSFSAPSESFYGQPPWALSLFDIWGSIIDQTDARIVALRSGAGGDMFEASLAELPNIDTPLITYWSQPQPVTNGKVNITMPVPRFQGQLRVMALAYNAEQTGIIEQNVFVREPVVSELYSPPYLTVGDNSHMRLRLHNTTASEQTLDVQLQADGIAMETLKQTLTLAPNEERWLAQAFSVSASGNAKISANINEARIERNLDIRATALPQISHRYLSLAPSEKQTVAQGSAYALGGLGIDYQDITQQLRDYPYYCSEQTASRLLGELYHSQPSHEIIVNTQAQLANLQESDGGFSLWGRDGYGQLWLSAYIGEALVKAKDDGKLSQPRLLDSTLNFLRQEMLSDYGYEIGYAYYVLAKAGVNLQGAVIAYAENLSALGYNSDNLETVLALHLYGEHDRAEALYQRLEPEDTSSRQTYQSRLSELAQRLKRLHELSDYQTVNRDIAETERSLQAQLDRYYSTQTLARLQALHSHNPRKQAIINGEAQQFNTLKAIAHDATSIENSGQTPLALTVSELVPSDPSATQENGYSISLRYQDQAGDYLDMDHVILNSAITITATISRDESISADASDIIFVYPYSAGEQGLAHDSDDDIDYPEYQENRDDRHIAAFHLNAGETHIQHSFAVRAVRAGQWQAPGMSLEDMYQSQYRAHYPVRQQSISDASELSLESLE